MGQSARTATSFAHDAAVPRRVASGRVRRSRAGRRAAQARVVLRPVTLAVCACLGVAMPGHAGTTTPLSTTTAVVLPNALPMPVSVTLGGQAQNIARVGTGKATQVGNLLAIDQTGSDKAIYDWSSFDIGASSSVTFQFKDAAGSALNRVSNAAAPSRLYGNLRSFYVDAAGKQVTGGELFLINRNGILMGKGAQVNVGGLFLSALDMSDADYLSGLQNSIQSVNPTFFQWVDKDPVTGAERATYDPATNYVKVEAGAQINTASGGRVFLLGAKVSNAGSISSPNGQVVLAAGSQVFLNTPSATASPLYMSEANANVPAVKGLLVEVNSSRKADESASNSGSISTPLGNTTIVGWAVNQTGRISATTSVAQNGSIFLQARSGVDARTDSTGNIYIKRAQQGGVLTLGPADDGTGASLTITPDNGSTAAANSTFTASRIELSGQTVDIQRQTQIVAHGGVVNVRAEDVPAGEATAQVQTGVVAPGSGRVLVGDGVRIDVSGTTDTEVSVARNFVSTAALGASDLKDAPIQKDGPLFHKAVNFDVRAAAPILGDTTAYSNAIMKTAGEFLSAGGKINLTATEAVVASQAATLNVSGGQVKFTEAMVNPSLLTGVNGKVYTLNTAPTDVVYAGIVGNNDTTPTRFGSKVVPSISGMGHLEAGYVQGSQGGALSVVAPKVVLDAQLQGRTIRGARQVAGLDTLAAASKLNIGAMDNGIATPILFGDALFRSAVLNDLTVTRDGGTLVNLYDRTQYPGISRVSATAINQGGFGNVNLATNGNLSIEEGADLNLPDLASLTLRAGGYTADKVLHRGIDLGGNITAHGGTVSVKTMGVSTTQAVNAATMSGDLTLHDGKTIDVSGNWVNQRLDGKLMASAFAGGAVTLSSGHGLVLGQGTAIDASGGATMGTNGVVKGANAGSITLESNTETQLLATDSRLGMQAMQVADTRLTAFGVNKGGSLSLRAGQVDVVANAGSRGLAQGAATGSLLVGADFFNQGGFASYSLDALTTMRVASGVTVAPRVNNWQATTAARAAATGAKVSQLMSEVRLADGLRQATNLSLSAKGTAEQASGDLTVGQGARLLGDVGSALTLTAGHSIDMDGSLQALAGQVNIGLNGRGKLIADPQGTSALHIGPDAVVDVSGATVYTPNTQGWQTGTVKGGGVITVGVDKDSNSISRVQLDASSQLLARGTEGQVDVARGLGESGPAYHRDTVASDGGDIRFNVGSGGGVLASQMSASGGNATAAGGSLTVNLIDSVQGKVAVQSAAVDSKLVAAQAKVSTQQVSQAGFADVTLVAPQEITFLSSLDWAVPRSLTLSAPVVSATQASAVKLHAGSVLRMGRPAALGTALTSLSAARIDGASLSLDAGLVLLQGQQAVKGFSALQVHGGSEIRLAGVNDASAAAWSGSLPGGLLTKADVTLDAPQVTVATASAYTLDATGAKVVVQGGDTSAPQPLSAGGQLTVKARTIAQDGVLRAPFGSITLDATESIELGAGETSVSGDGLTVPFGFTSGGGTSLYYIGAGQVSQPVDKAITLDAHGKTVTVGAAAKVKLAGGGVTEAFEFVPGTGGSKDVFLGALNGAFAIVPTVKTYAPTDEGLLSEGLISQASGKANTLALGNTITLGDVTVVNPGTGAASTLAAGTYAVLPARYALLPGAFLVKPATGANAGAASLGYSQALSDGSVVVGGVRGTQGAATSNVAPTAFVVMSSDVARRYSEIKVTQLDGYFADKAATAGVAAPRLAADAGRLSIGASQVALDGLIDFAHRTGLGGQLDLSATRIHVGDVAQSGALNVTVDQLNRTGADSILLGGVRQGTDAQGQSLATVTASSVTVDASPNSQAQAITVGDLTLAATNTVTVKDGVVIDASQGSGKKSGLTVRGNGALLRVSSDDTVATQRDLSGLKPAQIGATGDLLLGAVQLKGGTVVAEATRSNSMASTGTQVARVSANTLVVGAQRIVAGDLSGAGVVPDATTLVLSDALAAQFNQAKGLSLRSYSGMDLYQGAHLGSSTAQSLTLDTGTLRVKGDNAVATIDAGQVQLTNTTGVGPVQGDPGTGTLRITANGLNGGHGHITVGGGDMGVVGTAVARLDAAGSVVLAGQGSLSTPTDLLVSAQSLTTSQAAVSTLNATGWFKLDRTAQASAATVNAATPGAGAMVTVNAGTIDQQGLIAMPSANLKLNAVYQQRFAANSRTDLSGLTQTQDGVALDSQGGSLLATSAKANVTQYAGAVIDVSAGSGKGAAGSMAFSAPLGTVDLQGTLLARSNSAQSGGSLSVDSGKSIDLQNLANLVDAGRTSEFDNFKRAIDVRVRLKDQSLTLGAGTTFSAEQISLAADRGDLLAAGQLQARSVDGGTIALAAGGHLQVAATARLTAQAVGTPSGGESTGGLVSLSSAGQTRADGSVGAVQLQGGVIDTTGQQGGTNGTVKLRADQAAWAADTSTVATTFQGAGSVQVEAFKRLSASPADALGNQVIDDAAVAQATDAVASFFDASGGPSAADRLRARFTGGNTALASVLDLRAGVEFAAPKDLTLGSDLNLMSWRAPVGQQTAYTAAPVNLTLRAGNNLLVQGSISDGFANLSGLDADQHLADPTVATTDWIMPGRGADIRLVGGADLRAASMMATKATTDADGDLRIGSPVANDDGTLPNVLVRSTTGSISLAASRDVLLTNPSAAVYTTGRYVPATQNLHIDDLGDFSAALMDNSGDVPVYANVFLTGGGALQVRAGRDVVGLTDPAAAKNASQSVQSYFTDWWWRRRNEDGTADWWSRYDLFQQGFATFGGGNVTVEAGRDTWNVSASAAGSGYTDGSGAHTYGGGSVSLVAGRDVVGGGTLAAGNTRVFAGQDIQTGGWTSPDPKAFSDRAAMLTGLVTLYGNGLTSVTARRNLAFNQLTQAGLMPQAFALPSLDARFALWGLTPNAEVRFNAVAGDLSKTIDALTRFKYEDSSMTRRTTPVYDTPDTLLPAVASFQASGGSIDMATPLYQAAALTTASKGLPATQNLALDLLARDDLTVNSVVQLGADARVAAPTAASFDATILSYGSAITGDATQAPVRLEARLGDITFTDKVDLTSSLRMVAGRDIGSGDGGSNRLTVTHTEAQDLSLIQAGRDYNFSTSPNGDFGLNVDGPGELVVAAGRAINLNQSAGIRALGSRANPAVPAQSANITVLTGVNLAQAGALPATQAYFGVLGGMGVGDFAADLYAQLTSANQAWPGLNSAAAQAFAQQGVDQRLATVRALVGDAAYQQRVWQFMQRRYDSGLNQADALARFQALGADERAPLVGLLMTQAWASQVSLTQQLNAVQAMLTQRDGSYAQRLQAFVQQRTGQKLDTLSALKAYAALSPELQMLQATDVLKTEVASVVSRAAKLPIADRDPIYTQGYNAIDTVFPVTRASGHANLEMGASTIQTQQGSTVSVFSPNGAVNVGQLTASAGKRDASKLGLITAGGGNLDLVSRDDVLVNQSRVFTVGQGDELIWSSTKDVDAGRGGKTVTAAAAPVFYLDSNGQLQVDVTSAIAGSGIKSSGVARIAAPRGAINAGDAGIQADGGLELAAPVILNASLIQSPSVTGAPPPAPVNAAMAAAVPTQPTAAGVADAGQDKDTQAKKRRKRNVVLDFLGFGAGD